MNRKYRAYAKLVEEKKIDPRVALPGAFKHFWSLLRIPPPLYLPPFLAGILVGATNSAFYLLLAEALRVRFLHLAEWTPFELLFIFTFLAPLPIWAAWQTYKKISHSPVLPPWSSI